MIVRNVKNRGQMDASPEAMELLDLTNRVKGYECPHAVWQLQGHGNKTKHVSVNFEWDI